MHAVVRFVAWYVTISQICCNVLAALTAAVADIKCFHVNSQF